MGALVAQILILWVWAVALAVLEIEIEGGRGWAETLPTWFRTRGPVGRFWAVISGGRPATGYHLAIVSALLLAIHYPFAVGQEWTLGAELITISLYLTWVIVWDYTWFILNPYYGIGRFRRGNVWWYPGVWIGPVPADYLLAIGISAVVGLVARPAGASWDMVGEHFVVLGALIVLTPIAILGAPAFRRYYVGMRRPGTDDRPRAGITGPPATDADVFPWAERDPD